MSETDEWANPNPTDLGDTAAFELLRKLGLLPFKPCERGEFLGDLNINWARWEIQKAEAIKVAFQRAIGPHYIVFEGNLSPEGLEQLKQLWRDNPGKLIR